jgi:hypothetical protein
MWCVKCGTVIANTIVFSYSVSKEDIVLTVAPLFAILDGGVLSKNAPISDVLDGGVTYESAPLSDVLDSASTESRPSPTFDSTESDDTCNATLHKGMSVGGNAYRELKCTATACCAACVADSKCAAFVTSSQDSADGACLLKADLSGPHAKASNNCGVVRGTMPPPGPPPPPPHPPPPAPPSPPLPAGSPQWELVNATVLPVIGPTHPDVVKHTIQSGFETGQFFRLNGTFYYTANELGVCANAGVLWDLVTRAALWSAPASSGPWTRVATLRNGSHMQTVCKPPTALCRLPCGDSCCSGTSENPSFVTWAPTLIFAPSSVNGSGEKDVWNLFYSSNQNTHVGDDSFNGITWAVSTTDSMLGPYVDVVSSATPS